MEGLEFGGFLLPKEVFLAAFTVEATLVPCSCTTIGTVTNTDSWTRLLTETFQSGDSYCNQNEVHPCKIQKGKGVTTSCGFEASAMHPNTLDLGVCGTLETVRLVSNCYLTPSTNNKKCDVFELTNSPSLLAHSRTCLPESGHADVRDAASVS